MHIVIIPVLFLILVSVWKKMPFIGGKLEIAFIGAGALAFLLGGVYLPMDWINAWINGFDQLAFIIYIVILGSFFSALQIETGAMQTVLDVLRAIFGKTAQGLIFTTLITLFLGGSLVGTVSAVGAVIGILIVPALDDMGIDPDTICACIVTGGSVGALMPPISNAIFVSSGLLGVDTAPVLQTSYITVTICIAIVCLWWCKVVIGNKYKMPAHLIPKETAGQILKARWKSLIPLMVLITLVALYNIPSLKVDLVASLLKSIPYGEENVFTAFSKIKIIGKVTNNICTSLFIAIIVSLILRKNREVSGVKLFVKSFKDVGASIRIQSFAAFFLGAFKVSGQLDAIAVWADSLSDNLVKLGGAASLLMGGMLMGSQSSSQSILVPILGPAWMETGVEATSAAIAASHLAAAGQGLPPADLNTFIIAGLVASILHKKVDPMRSMVICLPYCLTFAAIGLLFLYI